LKFRLYITGDFSVFRITSTVVGKTFEVRAFPRTQDGLGLLVLFDVYLIIYDKRNVLGASALRQLLTHTVQYSTVVYYTVLEIFIIKGTKPAGARLGPINRKTLPHCTVLALSF
jgi:hypothetical protein